MIRTAICDDEANVRAYLSSLIRARSCPCEIVEYASAGDCLTDTQEIDLLFLDIELAPSGDSLDGMTLARKIRERTSETQPVIIFVTGYDRHVFDAFDVGALHYLLKPVDEEKFAQVFARAIEQIRTSWKRPDRGRALTFQSAGSGRTVPLDSIYYVESSNHKVVLLAEELLYAACLALFFRPFMPEKGRRQKLFLIIAADFLVFLLCRPVTVPPGAFCLLLTAGLMALSGVLGLEKRSVFLLSLFYWNAKNSSGLMVESLDFVATRLWIVPANDPAEIYLRSAALLSLLLLSHAAFLSVMLYALRCRLRRRPLPHDRRELCCLSLVPAAGILFGQMIARLLYEMKDGELLQLYERHPAFLAVVPVLAALFYAGAYLSVTFQQGMAALREEQAAHYVEYRQAQAIRERIHEAERFYTRVRELKHDLRGHLTNIKVLAQSGEYASLEDYISRMDESVNGFELTLQTGNPVTDVIVNDTRRRCLDLGVRFQADFHYPDPGAYDAFDVGVILQNLLQNALEACGTVSEDERFIALTGKRKGRFFLIEVKNSFEGEVVFGQDGLPVTTKKEDVPMHGLGLSSVRREAERYMGELELKTDRQEFSAAVLLQERSNL